MLEADQRSHIGVRIVWRADLQALRRFFQAADKLVKNRPLNINPLSTQANLATVGERGTHGAFDSLVHIAVRKHQAGILATELQGNIPDTFGGGFHNDLPGAGLAGKGEAIDQWMLGEVGAGRISAETMDHVIDTVRNTGLFHHFAKKGGRGRSFLRGFDHHRVPAGQGWSDLPGHQQQRQVPGADHANHAFGAANGIIQCTGAIRRGHFKRFGRNILDHVREHFEVGCAPGNVDVACQGFGLAGIEAFRLQELIKTGINTVRHLMENGGTLFQGHLAPRPPQCGLCGLHCGVNLFPSGFVDLADHFTVGGIDVLEQLATG